MSLDTAPPQYANGNGGAGRYGRDLKDSSPAVKRQPTEHVTHQFVQKLSDLIENVADETRAGIGRGDIEGEYSSLRDLAYHLRRLDVRDPRLTAIQLSMAYQSDGTLSFGKAQRAVIDRVTRDVDIDQAVTDLACVGVEDVIAIASTLVGLVESRLQPLKDQIFNLQELANRAFALESQLNLEQTQHRAELARAIRGATLSIPGEEQPLPLNVHRHGSGFRAGQRFLGKQWTGPARRTVEDAIHDRDIKRAEMMEQGWQPDPEDEVV